MSNHVEQLRAMGYEVRPALKNAATFRWWKTTDGDGVSVHPLDCSTETFATEAAAWHAAASIEGLSPSSDTPKSIKQATPATKLVEVRLSALTRVEYMEVVEVPADIAQEELDDLVNARYRQVDGGEFTSDPEYWERGTCEAVDSDMPDATPTMMAFRTEHGLHIERADAAAQHISGAGRAS